MAMGAGELIVAQYNHYCVLPVNPRRHSARAHERYFLPSHRLFVRIKHGRNGSLPAKKVQAPCGACFYLIVDFWLSTHPMPA